MIAWIMAMDCEYDAVVRNMKDPVKKHLGPVEICEGKIEGQPAIAALCGVGKVNAAMTTTLICECLKPSAILNLGVAGGVEPGQSVGDWVFGSTAIQADFDTSPLDGPEGLGMVFKADEKLLEKALEIAQEMDLSEWTGAIATQDLFLSRSEDYKRLKKLFPASLCAEMEGGAVAQVAEAFQIPFLIVRTLSDLAFEEGNPVQFSEFKDEVALRTSDFVKHWYRFEQ